MALALGGNLSDTLAALRLAWGALQGLLVEPRPSDLFRSTPLGSRRQSPYLNGAVVGLTDLGPADLLAATKQIEHSLGRRRGERWGPRRIDIDLLLYGQVTSELPELVLPHPGLCERDFVLQPLAQIAGDWPIPGQQGLTVSAALERLGPRARATRIEAELGQL